MLPGSKDEAGGTITEPSGDTPGKCSQMPGNLKENVDDDRSRQVLSLGTYSFLDHSPAQPVLSRDHPCPGGKDVLFKTLMLCSTA